MNTELKQELLSMMEEDQEANRVVFGPEGSGDPDVLKKIYRKNTKRMKEIIEEHGWPTFDLVGKEAAQAAWIIAQHSDFDLEFQEKCLELMEEAVKENQASKELFAYLIDRIRVNKGKPQLYGTQFYEDDEGNYGPRPIEDRENLDQRRKEMGMSSFEEYEKGLKKRAGKE